MRAKVRADVAKEEAMSNSSIIGSGGKRRVVMEELQLAKGLDGRRRAARRQGRRGEANTGAVEAVLDRFSFRHERAQKEAEITVDGAVRHGAKCFCVFKNKGLAWRSCALHGNCSSRCCSQWAALARSEGSKER